MSSEVWPNWRSSLNEAGTSRTKVGLDLRATYLDPRFDRVSAETNWKELKSKINRPSKAVVTAGMPYANGPVHLGHLAGAHVPADVYARWLRMLIGAENVLFVCGTDDHGSTSELAAIQAGKSVREFIDDTHAKQKTTLDRYGISLDVYSGTSRPDVFPWHKKFSQNILRNLFNGGFIEKKITKQWFDPKINRFLQDRFVKGKCPNPKCENRAAYSDECDVCGAQYNASELRDPVSALSDARPELRDTAHWWLDMWRVSEELRLWIESKAKTWRSPLFTQVIGTVMPALRFSNSFEEIYKLNKEALPKHKSKYAAGKKIFLQFASKPEMSAAQEQLKKLGVEVELADEWAHRSLSRDVSWGIPIPDELDSDMKGKTLYVWPDSLIAPISFSDLALKNRGLPENEYKKYWCDPHAKVFQFLGQDNVYFYTLMQGAMWLGSGEGLQMTEVFSAFHLMVDGEKMSKSRGNFFTGDQLLDEKNLDPDQVRYFLALLSLPEKSSNFDFANLAERNKFLAGPLNAAIEKPISAAISKFDGKVPFGKLNEKVALETGKMLEKYFKSMERGEYSTLLFAIENYARLINSMFTQFKPHDDRFPEQERRDALYSSFAVLKNMMIMLYPFVPQTMDRVRQSLRLPKDVFTVEELGKPMEGGHEIGEKTSYFSNVAEAAAPA